MITALPAWGLNGSLVGNFVCSGGYVLTLDISDKVCETSVDCEIQLCDAFAKMDGVCCECKTYNVATSFDCLIDSIEFALGY